MAPEEEQPQTTEAPAPDVQTGDVEGDVQVDTGDTGDPAAQEEPDISQADED